MSKWNEETRLEKIDINNFLSLRNVKLSLRPLTVLVGPNASGKSNVLRALDLLDRLMISDKLPSVDYLHDLLWAGGANHIGFQLSTIVQSTPVSYTLELSPRNESPIQRESLTVNDIEIISISDGSGIVRDENNTSIEVPYHPSRPKLALKSAGDYGEKPITSALYEFIRNWEFYDFSPEKMRQSDIARKVLINAKIMPKSTEIVTIDNDGSMLNPLLLNWHENHREQFSAVCDSLKNYINFGLESSGHNGDSELFLREGYDTLIPLKRASDGTLRLIVYNVLLNQMDLPSLIGLEEPERNLHPAALGSIARLLEQLAERTQVIITTHSSQLLDALNAEQLGDKLGILLLRNVAGEGTQVIDLETIRHDRSAFDGWMTDFGIGSAIFESQLLQDVMEG